MPLDPGHGSAALLFASEPSAVCSRRITSAILLGGLMPAPRPFTTRASRPLSRTLFLAGPGVAVAVLLGLAACKPAPPPPQPPPPVADLTGLEPGWNTIDGGPATTCSDG